VPLTQAVILALLNTASLAGPLVLSHGVPLTPDQLVALEFQVALFAPVHVPVAAVAD
jgi:hypothetical protein